MEKGEMLVKKEKLPENRKKGRKEQKAQREVLNSIKSGLLEVLAWQ